MGASVHEFEGKINETRDSFFTHMLNQHTTGYIQGLGLERDLKLSDMFTLL